MPEGNFSLVLASSAGELEAPLACAFVLDGSGEWMWICQMLLE
jgi:hypothetical protein